MAMQLAKKQQKKIKKLGREGESCSDIIRQLKSEFKRLNFDFEEIEYLRKRIEERMS